MTKLTNCYKLKIPLTIGYNTNEYQHKLQSFYRLSVSVHIHLNGKKIIYLYKQKKANWIRDLEMKNIQIESALRKVEYKDQP